MADDPLHNPFADAVSQSPMTSTTPAFDAPTAADLSTPRATDDSAVDAAAVAMERTLALNTTTPAAHHATAANNNNNALVANVTRKPSLFAITLSEPRVVKDGLLKTYTSYKVTTQTSAPGFKSESIVQRRFREFLWLYETLANRYPGVIVPPPPEKNALGRFEEEFVANRQLQLEKMVNRIARHEVLQKDSDFKAFLEVENLKVTIKEEKETKSSSSTSFMAKLGDAMSGSSFSKVTSEVDDYFDSKKSYIDNLESQLKGLLKAIDAMIKQREELGNATLESGESIISLSTAELNKSLEKQLSAFGQVQKSIRDIHYQQASSDLVHLANTVDEYLRIIGSIRNAYSIRNKVLQSHQQAQQNVIKARINLEKTKLTKTKPEKIASIEQEIVDGEQRIKDTLKECHEVSQTLKTELELFERDKVEDIQESIMYFLETVISNQEKMWETYLSESGLNEGMSSSVSAEETSSVSTL